MNIRKFSEHIGLSTATVSRAFSGRGVIDPDTRERVLSEARRMNFQPNVLAQRLSRQSSGVLGLYYCFGDEPIFDYYNMELAQEIAKAATAAGKGLHLELAARRTPGSDPSQSPLATLTGGKAIDGLVLVADGHESAEKLRAQIGDTPTVIISGQSWAIPPCHAQIVIDFAPGMQAAIDHLVRSGHERIGYLHGRVDDGKLRALQAALASHDLTLAGETTTVGSTFIDGERAFTQWRAEGLTAVICGTDILALGAMRAAAAAGVRLPHDFSLIGIDDLAIAAHSVPTLSSIGVPRETIAQSAIDVLLQTIDRAGQPGSASSASTPPPILTPTYFTARESSGPLSSKKVTRIHQTNTKP